MSKKSSKMRAHDTWKHFDQNPLTHSAAHYLMTILHLIDEVGYARITDIAKELEITPGSCSISIKALKKKGLIQDNESKFLQLSEEGAALASIVKKNDALLKQFFHEVLGVDAWQAEVDACKIEHLISIETSIQLEKFLSNYIKDKHKK